MRGGVGWGGGALCSQEQHSPTHAVFPIVTSSIECFKSFRQNCSIFSPSLFHKGDEPGPCTSPLEENPKDDADDDDGDEKKDAADGKDKHQSRLRWQCDAGLVRDIRDYFCCVCIVITSYA